MYYKILNTILSTITEYEKTHTLEKMWKAPLIKILPVKDKIFKTLKKTVSAEHLMPGDILPDAKSVISFFIPFHERIVKSNIAGTMASAEWATAYIKTNDLIAEINNNIELLMAKKNYKTGKIPATHNFNEEKLISNWSHRHIAYIAGIGTFGRNNMLITKKGCCGRFGSILINYKFCIYKPVIKTGKIKEKCLNKINGLCGVCQKKCVVNAYENNSFNRFACYAQCKKNAEYHKNIGHTDICGKCLVGLPCSTKEP